MKTCSACATEKDLTEFRKDRTQKDGYQPRCKSCAKTQHKSSYTEKYAATYNKRNNERRVACLQRLNEYKDSLQCEVCGETENICLDFHHKDPTEKDFTIGTSMGYSWKRIEEEIKKCVCICSNCHRKVHAGIIEL